SLTAHYLLQGLSNSIAQRATPSFKAFQKLPIGTLTLHILILLLGVPEDLLFFYKHIEKGGEVFRVNCCLLLYRYHPQAATHSVLEGTIWNHRVRFLEDRVLSYWTSFTIWNAGKQGKKLYRSLSPANQKKVTAFCDVDEKKITKGFYTYEESEEKPKPKIPICHFREATPPFIICVKLDLTGGAFEENLNTLNLKEGRDYYHFN
uniref:UDP-GlcNAc:betaGal beta-1,3-N-acetylglucosaminyltransferase like 1 n=1 Tax=Dromaius novaehollandiae TaxID=8790 RepID=A0A8C4JFJ0_DRONO